MIHTIYIAKLVFFYALGGILVATLTSGLPAFWHVSGWWNQPIVYEKVDLVDGAAGAHRTWPDRGARWPARSSR